MRMVGAQSVATRCQYTGRGSAICGGITQEVCGNSCDIPILILQQLEDGDQRRKRQRDDIGSGTELIDPHLGHRGCTINSMKPVWTKKIKNKLYCL